MSWGVVLAAIVAVLVYLRSPIDLVPDRLGAIGLLDDLLVLAVMIAWLRTRRRRPTATEAGAREAPSEPSDPWTVLGVGRGASSEEITRAYRERLKQYHPDRVAGLGEELQEVAHRRTIEIQRAYATLAKP